VQRVDEKLRARVRDIRTRAEADIAEVQQQVAEEEALIRRMQENLDDDEERQTVEAARRLRDMQIHSHVTLHEEIKVRPGATDSAFVGMLYGPGGR
jgi:hypothetical protein